MSQGQFIQYLPRFHHSSRHTAATPSTFSIYLATFNSSPIIRYLRVHAFISIHENKDRAGEVIIAREENVTLHYVSCSAHRLEQRWSKVHDLGRQAGFDFRDSHTVDHSKYW